MRISLIMTFFVLGAIGAPAQDAATQAVPSDQARPPEAAPVYRVTVVSRTTKAINYGTRSDATKIDFKGTVLMPEAHGEATVQSRQGAVEIQARFKHMPSPGRFGPNYLTYVLWAISPDGRPQNLGELVLDSADKGKLDVSTHFQSFALIVTAEPYFAVTQPSDVVVLENAVRPDTAGRVDALNARYELLPRTPFVYEIPAHPDAQEGPKVSRGEYESLLAIYEAQNALQLARAAGAEQYASDVFQKAEQLYRQAQEARAGKAGSKQVVTAAREAAQRAADARTISLKRHPAESAETSRAENPFARQAPAEAQ